MIDWSRSPFEPHIAHVQRVPGVEVVLREICEMTDMGFAALARVNDTHWIACQMLDKIGLAWNRAANSISRRRSATKSASGTRR